MNTKYYRPILKEGDHLVQSSKNPSRVRGQSRDSNNKNPDIVEWEEFEYEPFHDEERQVKLSPDEERLAQAIGEALGSLMVKSLELVLKTIVVSWWNRTAWPWIKKKCSEVHSAVRGKRITKEGQITEKRDYELKKQELLSYEISTQMDQVFEQTYISIDPEEANKHLMKIVYHMLAIANEIRILSNKQIREAGESEQEHQKRIEMAQRCLTEKVAQNIDKLLLEHAPCLDIKTSKKLFGMLGGGVILNGEYVHVEQIKVLKAIMAQTDNRSYKVD